MGHEYTMWKGNYRKETRYCYSQQNGEDINNHRCGNTWGQKNNRQGKVEYWKVPEPQKRDSQAMEPWENWRDTCDIGGSWECYKELWEICT